MRKVRNHQEEYCVSYLHCESTEAAEKTVLMKVLAQVLISYMKPWRHHGCHDLPICATRKLPRSSVFTTVTSRKCSHFTYIDYRQASNKCSSLYAWMCSETSKNDPENVHTSTSIGSSGCSRQFQNWSRANHFRLGLREAFQGLPRETDPAFAGDVVHIIFIGIGLRTDYILNMTTY